MPTHGTRFLSHKEFLRLCKELKVNSFNSDEGELWLELLEKWKILFPRYRVVYPLPYMKAIYKSRIDPKNTYLPARFEIVDTFRYKLRNFSITRNLFHVLDRQDNRITKYIYEPKNTKFISWKSYKKLLGTLNDIDHHQSIAEHYYSYWQVYHFYEIIRACTLNYVINVFDKKIFSDLYNREIPLKKIFTRTLPLNYSNIKGNFWGQSRNFEILSFYVQTFRKYNFLVSQSKVYKKNKLNYLDETSTTKYYQRLKTLTKLIIRGFNFDTTEAYNFLSFLCKRYNEYKEKREDNLAEFIKNDIYYLIQMMQHGFELEFETINKKLGRVINAFGNTLDVIFPPTFAEERDNVLHTLGSFLSSDLNFYRYKDVSKDEIEDFLNYLDLNNLQLFYHTLGQINITQLRNQTIYLHVLYLSLLLENLIKVIGRKSKNGDLVLSLSGYIEPKKALDKFFDSEGWKHSLFENWRFTTVDFSTNIKEVILNTISTGNFHPKSEWNEIIKMFLVCGIARNITTHEHLKVYNLDRDTYLILVNSIVTAIWFTWNYAIEKGYVSTE